MKCKSSVWKKTIARLRTFFRGKTPHFIWSFKGKKNQISRKYLVLFLYNLSNVSTSNEFSRVTLLFRPAIWYWNANKFLTYKLIQPTRLVLEPYCSSSESENITLPSDKNCWIIYMIFFFLVTLHKHDNWEPFSDINCSHPKLSKKQGFQFKFFWYCLFFPDLICNHVEQN